jgi:hypothetical protein
MTPPQNPTRRSARPLGTTSDTSTNCHCPPALRSSTTTKTTTNPGDTPQDDYDRDKVDAAVHQNKDQDVVTVRPPLMIQHEFHCSQFLIMLHR